MFGYRSSGKIGTAGVKPSPQPQPQQLQEPIKEQSEKKIDDSIFKLPKQKTKKLKFQRE